MKESKRTHRFLHLYIPSSATTALSTLCQGRLYPHIHLYIYTYIFFFFFFLNSDFMESRYKMDKLLVDNLIQGQQGKL